MSDKVKIINSRQAAVIPCVATRDVIVFPNMSLNFDVARERSVKALRAVFPDGDKIFLTAQLDNNVEEPEFRDVYHIGVVARIMHIQKSSDGITRVHVEGLYRAKLIELEENDQGYLEAVIKRMPNYSKEQFSDIEVEALTREVKRSFQEYASLMPRMPGELYQSVMDCRQSKQLFEAIAFNIPLSTEDRQELLEKNTVSEKLATLLSILAREINIVGIEKDIHTKVAGAMDKNQRDYYLREQMRVIAGELGEEDDTFSDGDAYIEKIKQLSLGGEIEEKLLGEAKRLMKMPPASQESAVIRNYLDACLELPWNEKTKDTTDIKKAAAILDRDHYGMKKVKERILETLSVRALSPDIKGQILCLYGPPGVGKTSIGRSVAEALGRKYVRVSLGGVKDESDIRGHRKTYVGAMPGRIINAMKLAKSKNPVMLLDEIDKMSNDFRGDPSSAMLEVLDAEQNKEFRDHYIELPFDLSDVMFITTANNIDTIQPPLLDRMEVIELSSYTREEKFEIAKRHLIPKQLEKNGLKKSMMKINDDAIYALIDSYTKEAGVRKLERAIGSLCRKAAREIVENEVKKVTFRASNLEKYLGAKKYKPDIVADKTEVGTVNGLAWTSVGGVIMPLEVLVLDGKGKIELTGSLGDVMKESARIAISYARSVAEKYKISPDFFEKKDIHIHAPEGAVPKDGPSAGVTLATAIISALSGVPVRSDVAMTGEITLRGRVLAIGGLREKTMAAYKAGVKTVVVPKDNKGDMDEVEDIVKENINFVFAETITDVLETALVRGEDKPQRKVGGQKKIPPEMMENHQKKETAVVSN